MIIRSFPDASRLRRGVDYCPIRTTGTTSPYEWKVRCDPQAVSRSAQSDQRNIIASQYLIEDAGPSLDPHQRALLASIEASGIRLLRLIEDFERSGKHSGKPAGSKEKPRRPYQSPVS
jgi:hypothetical protein